MSYDDSLSRALGKFALSVGKGNYDPLDFKAGWITRQSEIDALTTSLAEMKEQRNLLMHAIVELGTCIDIAAIQREIKNSYNLVCDIESSDTVKDEVCEFCKGKGYWILKIDDGEVSQSICNECHGTGKREAK